MSVGSEGRDRALWIEVALVVAFVTFVAWPFLSPNQYLTAYDTMTYSGPNLVVTTEQIRDGSIPAWNDDLFGGVPQLANPQVAALYPTRWLLAPLEPARAFDLTTAAHLYVLAAGTFVLLWRRLRLVAPARLVGTVALVGSGTIMARSVQFEQISVIAWIPWLLVATDWAIADRRWRPRALAATAGATAMLLLSGHPQQMYIGIAVVAGWCVGRAIDATRPGPTEAGGAGPRAAAIARRAVRVGAGMGLGALLAAPQLVATALLVREAELGANQSLAQASTYGYVIKPSLLAPTFLGNPFAEDLNLTAMGSEAVAFVGVAVIVAALVGLADGFGARSRRATVAVLGIAALGSTLLALGPRCTDAAGELTCSASGLGFRAARAVVPGFSQTRASGRWVLVATIALALLAAFGVDALARRAVTRRSLAIAGGLLAALALVALVAGPTADGGVDGRTIVWWAVGAVVAIAAFALGALAPRRPAPILGAGVVAAVVLIELTAPASHSIARQHLTDEPFTAYPSPISERLAAEGGLVISVAGTRFDDWPYLGHALRPNANATYGARSIDGYDGGPWVTKRWVAGVSSIAVEDFDATLPVSWQLALPLDAQDLARLGVGWAVVDRAPVGQPDGLPAAAADAEARTIATVAPGWGTPQAREGDLVLLANPIRTTEAYLARSSGSAPDAATASSSLEDLGPDEVITEPPGPAYRCDGNPGACAPVPVDVERPEPGLARAHVEDAPADSILSIASQPLPGWSATIDGQPVEVYAVDAMRLGVTMPGGTHDVEFRYRQPGLVASGLVALLALLLVAVFVIEPGRLRPPPPSA